MTYANAHARTERLVRLPYLRAFTALVRVGAFEPISPEPGVYAWAPVRVDPRVREITARAVADVLSDGGAS